MPALRSNQKGFTLLELLVAVAIFAMLGIGSYQLLATTIATRDAARTHDSDLIRLQKVFTVLNRDMAQVIARPVRNDYGDPEAALILKNNTLEFSRQGWPNPLQSSRSELQRIRYEVNTKGELWRLAWSQLDRERGMEPGRSLLLDKVQGLQIRVIAGSGQQETDWPSQRNQGNANNDAALSEMPSGVELILNLKPWGEIRRVFLLPDTREAEPNEQPS
ncbi:MAG TPA: type II secretion system minor pseudopilin GspJ [Fluviicoccus sp.]|nr:type II secretion system minor pseudopilin GspJ [Fluviicoccus sp.]